MKTSKTLIIIFTVAIVVAMVCFLLSYFGIFNLKNSHTFEKIISQPKDITVFFAGDNMFDRGIKHYADLNGGNDFTFAKVHDFLLSHDLNVVNLEGPITDNKSQSMNSKVGAPNNYVFTFDPSWANTLKKNNISLVGIANNHILNFEERGVESTKSYLTKAGVDYFGEPYGKRSAIKDVGGVKIGFVAYNEFLEDYVKDKNEAVAEIKKLRGSVDLVIVFCHWGIEYQKEASPVQKEFAREFIDAGADVVLGAHPHVIEPMEEYKGKRIYYSLGNFIFDQYFDENVRKGLGVVMTINKETKNISFEEKHFYLESNGQTALLSEELKK